jgi:hypothetical protein
MTMTTGGGGEVGQDRLGRYTWLEDYGKNIIKYYPKHNRFACVHTQERLYDGIVAAICVFVQSG